MGQVSENTAVILQTLIESETRDVLLVFHARWHARSNEMAEEVRRLGRRYADELVPFCVDVDGDVEVAMSFGMRALPLCILLRRGGEISRTAGAVGAADLQEWLWRNGVARSTMPAGFPLELPGCSRGAFHADVSVRQRVCQLLRERAASGSILRRRIPFWDGHAGTISGAVAGSMRPDILETHSGLPFSFACTLEILSLDWTPEEVDAILGSVATGADLSQIAVRLMHGIFSDPEVLWGNLLDDTRIDQLRLQWLCAVERQLAGTVVPQAEWDAMLVGLGLRRSSRRSPDRSVQDCVVDMLCILSPPPPHDSDLWVNAFSLHGVHFAYILISHHLGWRPEDFAFEGVRAQWFMAREALEPGGKFSRARLRQMHEVWLEEMGAAQEAYDEKLHEAVLRLPLVTQRFRSMLLDLIGRATVAGS